MVSGVAGRFLPLTRDLGVMIAPGSHLLFIGWLGAQPRRPAARSTTPRYANACACPMGRWTGGDRPILRGRSDQLSDLPAHRVRPNHPKKPQESWGCKTYHTSQTIFAKML